MPGRIASRAGMRVRGRNACTVQRQRDLISLLGAVPGFVNAPIAVIAAVADLNRRHKARHHVTLKNGEAREWALQKQCIVINTTNCTGQRARSCFEPKRKFRVQMYVAVKAKESLLDYWMASNGAEQSRFDRAIGAVWIS